MIIVVDERDFVRDAYLSQFERSGVAAIGFSPEGFRDWYRSEVHDEVEAVSGIIIDSQTCGQFDIRSVRQRLRVPVCALMETADLEMTLRLFGAGVDDVLRKPIHAREIIARVSLIARRQDNRERVFTLGDLKVYFDGRDPTVAGEVFPLPRRERRLLEYLASKEGKRATKSQIFNALYGVFNEDVEENVIESHLSKLRKKLRTTLGFDPIDSKRFLGYSLLQEVPARCAAQDDVDFPVLRHTA